MRRRALLLSAVAATLAGVGVGAALFPLSLALSLSGQPIEGDARGRVWNGVIENARAEGLDLGTVRLRPRVLALLRGRLAAPFDIDGPAGRGTGAVLLSSDALLVDYDGTLGLAALGARDVLGRPLGGTAEIAARGLRLTEAGCQAGTLDVETDALGQTVRALGLPASGPTLSGRGACADGVLMLPLEGRGVDGGAAALIRLNGRRYVTELTLNPSDPRAAEALAAFGFQRTPNGYSVVTRGSF